MEDDFLTIRESTEFAAKSDITIRRLIREVVRNGTAEQRRMVLPSPEEIEQLRTKNQPYTYRVSKTLLRERFGLLDQAETSQADQSPNTSAAISQVLMVLRQQLERKDDQIQQLGERLHESHFLVKQLQDRLALPEGKNGDSGHSHSPTPKNRRPGLFRRFLTRSR